MTCNNCGHTSEGKRYCEKCGATLNIEEQQLNTENTNSELNKPDYNPVPPYPQQQPVNNTQGGWQQQGQPYAPPHTQNPYAPYQQPHAQNNMNTEQSPTTSTYIKWFLIQMIPFVGLVLSIIYALDNTNMTRRNYFRAILIWGVICGIIAGFLFAIVGIIGARVITDYGYSSDYFNYMALMFFR